jgi:hypothetical protein
MTKRSVALVGVLVVMAMIGSSVIGAVSAWATSDAANGTYSVFLPLIMNAIGAMAEVPQGAVMTFNLTSCPAGWTEMTAAQGRAIVGMPSGGTLSGHVGDPMGDLESKSHRHQIASYSADVGIGGIHNHWIDPPTTVTTNDIHTHRWAYINSGSNWRTWTSAGTTTREMVNYGDGMDTGGSGTYPVADSVPGSGSRYSYTDDDSHSHSVDIAAFLDDVEPHHTHSVGWGGEYTNPVYTSDTISYIQFLVCEKD